jgi:hypothetical protein
METKLTEEQIIEKVAELKKKHKIKEVFVIESDEKIAFLKKPSRDQLKYAMSVSQNDPLGLTEHILESGWLEGDELLKTDDKYFLDISRQIDELIETVTVSIKKY